MSDFDVVQDSDGNYVLRHANGNMQSMAANTADQLGVKGLFDSHIASKAPEITVPPVQESGAQDPDAIWRTLGNLPVKGLNYLRTNNGAEAIPLPFQTQSPQIPLRQVADIGSGQQYNAPGTGMQIVPQVGLPQAPQQPVPMQMEQSQTTSTTKGKALPEANKKEIADAFHDQQAAENYKASVLDAKSTALADNIVMTAKAAEKADIDLKDAEKVRAAQYQEKVNEYQKTLDDIKNTPSQSFWDKKTTGTKIGAGIAMALGALGSALTKGPNYAVQIIDKAIDDDLNQQKLDLEKKGQTARGQENLLAQMRLRLGDDRQAEIAAKRSMLDNAELQMKGVAMRFQGEEAQANAKAFGAALSEQKAKLDAEFALSAQDAVTNQSTAGVRMDTTKGAAGGTPDQYKVAGFAARVSEAENDMQRLKGSGYNAEDLSSAVGRKLPNAAQSKEAQQQAQAERNFVNAVLRRESGAAISPAEFESAEAQYFPRAGDKPETIAQKKRNRATVFKSLQSEAGPVYQRVKGPPSATELFQTIGAKKN